MNTFEQIAHNTKVAVVTATATTTTGMGTWFNWIPSDIGKLASLCGAVLTTVLIITHLYKLFKDIKQDKQRK